MKPSAGPNPGWRSSRVLLYGASSGRRYAEDLQAYLADLRRHGRLDTAREAEGRFKAVIYGDALADLELEAVTRDDFLDWRDRLLEGRQPRTVNRHARSVQAALNQAVELGYVGNPAAWRLKALSDDVDEGGETAVFLDAAHREAVIAAATPAAGRFFRGLELTGARPGSSQPPWWQISTVGP
jgi:hypothetical protein